MLFKLAFENIKKSFKDYAIYFITLVLGVTIFYMFNSIDSQEAMLQVSSSQKEFIKIMIQMLGFISIFVAVILGLLIVYANNFLINRRKKEFGIYMTLGMGKRQISKIILMETVFISVISLLVGLVFGIFGSQLMSILVAKMFQANMSKFEFVFSSAACIKTCIYFAIMYVAVMIFNTITISRYKLISLLNAIKKNEKVKIKNPIISIFIFLIGACILGWAYYTVTIGFETLTKDEKLLPPILAGIVGTLLIFWSLSGFIIKVIQSMKGLYLKDTNIFVLRQINNKINTTVVSMSIICIMLFITITILSVSLSIRSTMEKDLKEMTPVDINLYKTANLPEKYINMYGREIICTKEQIDDSHLLVSDTLINNGLNLNILKDIVEVTIYTDKNVTWETFFGSHIDEVKAKFPGLLYENAEEIVKVSDYNKIARLYGIDEYELNDDEYIMLCDFKNMVDLRNTVLKDGNTLEIAGKKYKSKYSECKSGYIMMSTSHVNTGIILVPDSCNLTDDMKEEFLLSANYNANTKEEREKIDEIFRSSDSGFVQKLADSGINIDGMTKVTIIESSVGLVTIITFIAIYLGTIFLISSAAILALKQLTESSDNKQRYLILRKIGCDEKMIKKSLFIQIGIFFAVPLVFAVIHSIFGIQFALKTMSALASAEELLPSIIATIAIIGGIYGTYFIATYIESKNIIKECNN